MKRKFMTQQEVLRKAFLKGAQLTSRQIRGVYKIASPSKVVSRLRRDDGVPIVSRVKYNENGSRIQTFSLTKPRYDVIVKGYQSLFGDPPAKVIAAGFRVVGA